MSYNIRNISEDEICCVNCEHWVINSQFSGPADGVICELGNGHTDPTDSCNSFREPTPTGGMMIGGGECAWERDSKIEYYLRWLR